MRVFLVVILTFIIHVGYCHEPEIYQGIGQATVLSGDAIYLPFDAKIQACNIRPGQQVKKNQALFLLDTSTLEKELQKLEVEHLELKQNLHDLEKNSLNLSEEAINLRQALQEKEYAQKRLLDSQKLLHAGIISQEEYWWDKRRFHQANDQYKKQLAMHRQTRNQNLIKERRVLLYKKLKQIQARVHYIKKYISNPRFYAFSDGLVLPVKLKNNEFYCHAGEKFVSDQILFWLAPLENRRIEIKMDQIELQQVKIGQKAEIVYQGNLKLKKASEVMEIDAIPESNNLPPKYKVFLKVNDMPDLKLGTQVRVKVYFE